jgi:hypothetical protein
LQNEHINTPTPNIQLIYDMLQFLKTLVFGRPKPGRKFTCFSSLPVELQLEIWRFALPAPRIVVLTLQQDRPQNKDKAQYEDINLLYTCRNSRQVVCQSYRRMNDGRTCRPFYLNAVKDILLVRNTFYLLLPFCELPVAELNGCVSVLAVEAWLPANHDLFPHFAMSSRRLGV